jgi:general stress protein 26
MRDDGVLDVGVLLRVVEGLLHANPYGFLVSGAARHHVRLVHHLSASTPDELWFGVSIGSRKVGDVEADPTTAYAVEDRSRAAYAALHGTTEVSTDLAVLERHWTGPLATFFPGGPGGGDFVLLRMVPVRIEIMAFADAIHPDPFGLRPAVLARRSDGAEWSQANS